MSALLTRDPRPAGGIVVGLLHYPGVRCPSCGCRQFLIGRVTADCARCEHALLLTTPQPERTDA